jgi:quinol monooxygenase YgiN
VPLTVVAIFRAQEGHQDELLAAIQKVAPDVHAEPGCRRYAPHRSGRSKVMIVESWADRDALDAHAAARPFARLQEAIAGLLDGAPEITLATPEPIGDPERGAL